MHVVPVLGLSEWVTSIFYLNISTYSICRKTLEDRDMFAMDLR